METALLHRPLVELAWSAEERSARIARNVALVIGGSALLALSAKVQIPFVPVPMTMQTFAVLVVGMAYGWRLGAGTVLAYLAQGALGLPVFAGAIAGPAYLVGPTGGYLAGFVFAAALTGWLAERGFDRRVATTALGMSLGTALILFSGVIWLARFVDPEQALSLGLVPFLPAAVFKIALATWLLPVVRRALSRRAG